MSHKIPGIVLTSSYDCLPLLVQNLGTFRGGVKVFTKMLCCSFRTMQQFHQYWYDPEVFRFPGPVILITVNLIATGSLFLTWFS